MLALFSFCRVSSYRLGDLVAIFASLYLSSNRAEDDDLLGDAYEDLMRHFATESGKSKGQFYTPSESPRKLVMKHHYSASQSIFKST